MSDNEAEVDDDLFPSHQPSSVITSATNSDNNNSLLRQFRDQWKAELTVVASTPDSDHTPSNVTETTIAATSKPASADAKHVNTDEEITEATKLFEQGSQLEEVGRVFEAMHLYRRAMQIVPNIEMHVYQNEKERLAAVEQQSTVMSSAIVKTSSTAAVETIEDLQDVDLLARFQHGCHQSGAFIQRGSDRPTNAIGGGVIATTATGHSRSQCHIGDMPTEVLLYILRWVVSGQLDLRSLEQCALVSRGFYICARDPDIWRLACRRVWGEPEARIARPAFDSWRHMYRDKARIQLHGVYTSKTSYFRHGENSFQDQFYRPMHLIEYYRYVRFFADGRAYMLTTPEAPAAIVPRLVAAVRQPQRPDLLCGTYRIEVGGMVALRLRRQRVVADERLLGGGGPFARRRRASAAMAAAASAGAHDADRNQTYRIEFRIRNRRAANAGAASGLEQRTSALVWNSYATYGDVAGSGQPEESVLHTEFELKPSMYPALVFDAVEAFHSVAAEPLA